MSRSVAVRQTGVRALPRRLPAVGHVHMLFAAGLLALVALGPWSAVPVQAAAPPSVGSALAARLPDTGSVRDSRDYVFTIGIIAGVTDRTVTLRFEDGQTETYTLDASTTIQTQNGDAQRLADLKAGNMAMVLSVERTTTAVTIVNGGDAGFHEATPADIRGHDDDCPACDERPT